VCVSNTQECQREDEEIVKDRRNGSHRIDLAMVVRPSVVNAGARFDRAPTIAVRTTASE